MDLKLHCEGADSYVQWKIDQDILCFFHLIQLVEKMGYTSQDFLYYKKRQLTASCVSNLCAIHTDADVNQMIKEYQDLRTVSLCVMKKEATRPHISPVKLNSSTSHIEEFLVSDDDYDDIEESSEDDDMEGRRLLKPPKLRHLRQVM
jgi:hypothetical protein